MNAGLSSLTVLKAWLLAAGLRDATDYDAQITALGLGVAAQFERYCSRKFQRVVGDIYETNADRLSMVVDRFPIEAITKIEIRDDLATGWVDQGNVNDVLFSAAEKSGLLEFAGYLGTRTSRIRITYTGGYWFDTTEDASGTLPTGATALPDDLKMAWLLQCESVWKIHDKLGQSIAESSGGGGTALLGLSLPGLNTVPLVEATLRNYVRYSSS